MDPRGVLGRALGPVLLPAKLARFFRRAPSAGSGLASLRSAIASREARFLAMARREIYGRPRGIYARLLDRAGCTYEDLRALVAADGLEAALARLAAEGVRLSEAEFRGRADVERPGFRARAHADDLVPARFDVGLLANSSGSGGSVLPCLYPIEWMELEASVVEAFLGAHELREHVHATDDARLTGGAGPKFMTYLGRHGIGCARWFVRDVPLAGVMLRAYHDVVARELAFAGRWFGRGFPRPTVATDADVVAWIAAERRAGRRCCLRLAVGRAVDLVRAAETSGAVLAGTVFVVSGEPLTAARRRVIEASGARVIPQYGFIPGGLLGVGCARPTAPDDMHVMAHTLAVVGDPRGAEAPRRRVLVTTLNARAPSIQLNVENGDVAEIVDRDCGCLLGASGLRRHVARVGSDRQLTLGGVKYPVEGLVALVEQALPERCGGRVGDYQLVEEQESDGRGYLTLRVHPRVAEPRADLLEALRDTLASGSRGARFITRGWSERGALRVVREAPAVSARGKVPAVVTLATHLRRAASEADEPAPEAKTE